MICTLWFNTDDRQDCEELDMALHGWKWRMAIRDYDNWLRGKLKHGGLDDTTQTALDMARARLLEGLEENGIGL